MLGGALRATILGFYRSQRSPPLSPHRMPSFVSLQDAVAVMQGLMARLTERLYSADSGSPGSLDALKDARSLLDDLHQGWLQVQQATCNSMHRRAPGVHRQLQSVKGHCLVTCIRAGAGSGNNM